MEDAVLEPPYGLVVAGMSIHWMDISWVLRKFATALTPGGFLSLVSGDAPYSMHRGRTKKELSPVAEFIYKGQWQSSGGMARDARATERSSAPPPWISAGRAQDHFTDADNRRASPITCDASIRAPVGPRITSAKKLICRVRLRDDEIAHALCERRDAPVFSPDAHRMGPSPSRPRSDNDASSLRQSQVVNRLSKIDSLARS